MRNIQVITVLFGGLLMSGCGDQVWCGENGCGADRNVSIPANQMVVQNSPILQNML